MNTSGTVHRWNIRRGFNRLFVVFSFCWYVAGVIVLWPQWADFFEADRIARIRRDPEPTIATAQPVIPEPPPGFVLENQSKEKRFYTEEELDRFDKQQAEKEQKAATDTTEMDRKAAIDTARELRPLRMTAFFALTPPILYGFVVAMLWVVRGFDRDS